MRWSPGRFTAQTLMIDAEINTRLHTAAKHEIRTYFTVSRGLTRFKKKIMCDVFCLLFYQTTLVVPTSDQSLQIIQPLCFPCGSRVVPTRHQLTSSALHTKVPLQEMRQSIWHASAPAPSLTDRMNEWMKSWGVVVVLFRQPLRWRWKMKTTVSYQDKI